MSISHHNGLALKSDDPAAQKRAFKLWGLAAVRGERSGTLRKLEKQITDAVSELQKK